MPPAVIAAGAVAAGTIGGALIGSSAQKKAANQANQAQQEGTAAQLQLGQESLALNKDIYNSNYDLLSPWVSRGNVAGNAYSQMLGLPSAPVLSSPLRAPTSTGGTSGTSAPSSQGGGYGGPSLSQILAMRDDGIPKNYEAAMNTLTGWKSAHPGQDPFSPVAAPAPAPAPGGQPSPSAGTAARTGPRPMRSDFRGDPTGFRNALSTWQHGTQTPATGGAAGSAPGAPASGAAGGNNAYQDFANSAGMQFQLKTGTDAINNMYAGRGALQSGSAMKAISDYGQHTALNNYFMPYMGMLGGLSAQGAQAGSAVAGVGSNFGNTAAGINNQMGQAIGNGADAASNAALLRGQANANMWGSIGGALGTLGSSFMPRPTY